MPPPSRTVTPDGASTRWTRSSHGPCSTLVDSIGHSPASPGSTASWREEARAAGADGHGRVEGLRQDRARAGTATQSSTDGGDTTGEASAALDGDITTDTRTLDEPGAWWQVDLGSVQHVRQVEVWNDASTTTADFTVELSATADFADATTVPVSGPALRPTLLDTDRDARYVRVRLADGGRIGLAQVQVHP